MCSDDLNAQYEKWKVEKASKGADVSDVTYADWCQYVLNIQAIQEEILYGKVIGLNDEDAVLKYATYVVSQQPDPKNTADMPASWDLVLADIKARNEFGIKKYGVPLKPHNGRDTLVDAYQEALDLVVYLRSLIYERDGK